MAKIKIVHIITRFDKGGSSENTFLTTLGLDKDKYDVILIKGLSGESLMGENEATAVEKNLIEAESSGIKVINVAELMRNIHPINDLKAFFSLISIIRNERPDIVHTHTSKAGLLGRLAAFICKVPIIIHTPHGHVFWGYFNKWKTAIFISLERLTALITDKIITLTDQEKKDHLNHRIAHDSKFATIHSGVDLSKFSDTQVNVKEIKIKLGIPVGVFVVGTIGRLTKVKGHKYFIKAAKMTLASQPDMIFILLGDGELANELKELTTTLGITDKVRFWGWRPDVAHVMSTFDVFVLPSLNEGMGKVLIEAMAMGKPIIASDVGGIPDLITHGKNGLLVPPGDSEAIAMNIITLYRNPSKRTAMGVEGKKISSQYNLRIMINKLETLYSELLRVKII